MKCHLLLEVCPLDKTSNDTYIYHRWCPKPCIIYELFINNFINYLCSIHESLRKSHVNYDTVCMIDYHNKIHETPYFSVKFTDLFYLYIRFYILLNVLLNLEYCLRVVGLH